MARLARWCYRHRFVVVLAWLVVLLSVIGIDLHCQCEYDQVLAVNPDDPSTMYMGQIKLHRSRDGEEGRTRNPTSRNAPRPLDDRS